MRKLFVLYDPRCGFCLECRKWLGRQVWLVDLEFVALGSPVAAMLFPDLAQVVPPDELVAVSDEGDIWFGAEAWLMCLWALRDTREWSHRLASPALLPLARQAFGVVSRSRGMLSRWLRLLPEESVAEELRRTPVASSCTRVPPVAFARVAR